MADNVIALSNLVRHFGKKVVLNNISFAVPRGSVFGLLGENGAGKTTIIKHLLGLLRAQKGTVSVFGMDPVKHPEEVLGNIGYLSEERDLPSWMTINELIRYTEPFYPNWDSTYASALLEMFELNGKQKIKSLSRGQRARAAMLIALAHKPDLLLLDEPSSGLDPVVRRDILGAIIRTVIDDGRTVLFSSHLLEEVERVTDYVAMIHNGDLLFADTMDHIKASHHKITLHFDQPCETMPTLPGVQHAVGGPDEWTVICNNESNNFNSAAGSCGASIVSQVTPTLEEIFISMVGK